MPFARTYTDEQFLQAIKDSKYMGETLRRLGLTEGSRQSANKLLKKLKPDISHWIDANVLKLSNFKTGLVEIPLEEILVKNSKYTYSDLKGKLIKNKLLEDKCSECGLKDQWNGKLLVLQIDHINGEHDDNRIENLRLLCPNCHSQTDTFCGKHKSTRLPKCNYCDALVRDKRSKTCKDCYQKYDRLSNWPTNEKLIEMLNENTFKEISQLLKINESSIRKRVYKRGLDSSIIRCKKKGN